jgi:hypothetical protein
MIYSIINININYLYLNGSDNMMDLHTHTLHSDGILTVNELVKNAVDNNVEILSITDHDTIDGLSEYQKNGFRNDIVVVPGIEFSTDTYYLGKKTKIHLLGYGYNINNNSISMVLKELYNRRSNDNLEYVDGVIKNFSYLSKEQFAGIDYGKYGWIHRKILNAVNSYLSKEQLEQLKHYLINNKPNYNKYNERVEDMISLIHDNNGYAVFAHPQKCDITKDELEQLIKYLKEIGLDGLETYHLDSCQNDRKYIHSLALRYDLYETGGSDFHSFEYGDGVGDKNINFPVDYEPLLVKKIIKEKKVLGGTNE